MHTVTYAQKATADAAQNKWIMAMTNTSVTGLNGAPKQVSFGIVELGVWYFCLTFYKI